MGDAEVPMVGAESGSSMNEAPPAGKHKEAVIVPGRESSRRLALHPCCRSDAPSDSDEDALQIESTGLLSHESTSGDLQGSRWHDAMTYTEGVKIHLARALITNPEVLVLQRPLHHFELRDAKEVMKVLREHCDQRGLAMDESSRLRRRPRTIFYSPDAKQQVQDFADKIWQVAGHESRVQSKRLSLEDRRSSAAWGASSVYETTIECVTEHLGPLQQGSVSEETSMRQTNPRR